MNPVATKEMETCATWVAAGGQRIFVSHGSTGGEADEMLDLVPLFTVVVAVERICVRMARLDLVKLVFGYSVISHRLIAVP